MLRILRAYYYYLDSICITLLEEVDKSIGTSEYERVKQCLTDFQLHHRLTLKFGDWMEQHTLW